ncbi:patatin-like phospholipase family protein [Moorella sulfitireducens]|uniref:patatin-like phospholipase family protein n=1 Tax=Neomoorella sulfitireducens TaxID=2972948 RepID=UPI0021AD2DD8|nr:patatin-like phospholipase family protein [Moorella sulfitireducens]
MRFGLALGGGGLKGAAHLGVLIVLEENNIKPDIVVGTSAGSIAAALYGAGLLPVVSTMESLPFANIFRLENYRLTGLPLGLIQGGTIEGMLKKALGSRHLSELSPLTAAVACDLMSGETVIYTSARPVKPLPPDMAMGGDVPAWQAVRASISIPALFAPYKIGSRLLVDGGLTDNVPADIASYLGADVVIAVDLDCRVVTNRAFRHAGEVLVQSLDIISRRNTTLALKLYADLVLKPIKKPVSFWDFGEFGTLVAAGAEEARRNLPQIRRLLGR